VASCCPDDLGEFRQPFPVTPDPRTGPHESKKSARDPGDGHYAGSPRLRWGFAGVSPSVSSSPTSRLRILTPAAASFYTWGADHGEHISFGGIPKTGDAVILYPPGTKAPNGSYADHVGIVTAVHPDGAVNLVNGDFLGASNISVQYNAHVRLSTWASRVEGNKGEKWAFVSPLL
jgi:hypothetical protein